MDDINANFCFPLLQNERVKLVPFLASTHADAFCTSADDALFAYLPWGPFATAEDFISTVLEKRIRPDPGIALFAVIDQTSAELAGTIGLFSTSALHPNSEIGFIMFIITLPRFQRTHVASNAAGLLLHFLLDAPAAGGLGLRRVAWKANTQNTQSVRAAERLGFRKEGVLRWDRVLPEWKTEVMGGNGGAARDGDPRPKCLGGDSIRAGLVLGRLGGWRARGRRRVNEAHYIKLQKSKYVLATNQVPSHPNS
ncbi:acyl-CoA N-acyltransferase [Mycena maculata]|uniref:Acyl-CoA N-acyltransferase n=1 Tax=Mycena maculata TaxID=230809 RepID=A0AAD7MMG3_9AGAR|nr:acyl-CoA N-acyltransferase [Mycena maculata]